MSELEDQRRKTLEAGKTLLLAKSAFAREMIHLWHMTPACDDDTGFRLLELFRKEVQTYVFDYKRKADPGLKHAANEMYRLIAVGQADYTAQEMDGFVKWYEDLTNRIAHAVSGLFDFYGDSFSDLCDSLPLAGTVVVKKCLATGEKSNRDGFLEESEIKDAVVEAAGPEWGKFVCSGENYVERSLESQMRRWFLSNLLRDKEQFPTSQEQEAVSYAGHLDD